MPRKGNTPKREVLPDPVYGSVVVAKLINSIIDNRKKGKRHHIIINAEGIGHSASMARRIEAATGLETRATILGYMQRGGSPCPYDRVFATRLGAEAGKLILKGEYGFMVGYKNREVVKVSLEDVAGKLKMVSPDASIVKEAKMVGISFGD